MLRKISNHMDGIAQNRALAEERMNKGSTSQIGGESQNKNQAILKTYDQAVSEIEVVQNEIQKYMIKVSFKMFENET